MKKKLIILAFFASIYNFGQVGIETKNPQETLDVNGTLRISDMPLNGKENALYNGNSTKNTRFQATKNVVADDNGNLGITDLPVANGDAGYRDINTNLATHSTTLITPTQLTQQLYTKINNSDLIVTVPEGANKNHVVVNWVSTYMRVRKDNTIPNNNDSAHPNNANLNFKLHGRLSKKVNNSFQVIETILLAEEYFYPSAHRGVFTKTVPAMYIKQNLEAGEYKFELYVGKSEANTDFYTYANGDRVDKQFYLRNTHISGEAKLFVK